jgi:hypothetical protein
MYRIVLALSLTLALAQSAAAEIKFKKTVLDTKFRAEGVAVGDFNKDGKLDVATGEGYYAAPDWKLVPIREQVREFKGDGGYSKCFQAWADDFNGDGWTDLLVVEFPGTPTVWLENPKGVERPWPSHVAIAVTNNESPEYLDVDGDGKRELLCGTSDDPKASDGPEKYVAIARPDADPTAPWKVTRVSAKNVDMARKFYHGIGIGDIDGDKRTDIVTPGGWWKGPESPADGEWKFNAAKLGEPCAQMYVYDFDGDGDADVLSTAAHKLGMWWHEQTKDGWQQHEISTLFSQTHALLFMDLNGDKLPDFITGKRFWAHGSKGDVDPGAPAVLYWFELAIKDGKPSWTPHKIDDDSGVGTQFQMTDVNGDGKVDIAIANKKGVFLFEQE